mmetsp:Transcript_101544/g.201683  ORF Transcript_101544/g.201683 Transcript_101544/m.201683 type:complete len:115 (-) Transcript_101544:17-361(-)
MGAAPHFKLLAFPTQSPENRLSISTTKLAWLVKPAWVSFFRVSMFIPTLSISEKASVWMPFRIPQPLVRVDSMNHNSGKGKLHLNMHRHMECRLRQSNLRCWHRHGNFRKLDHF